MEKLYKWIVLALFLGILIYGFISNRRYEKLEREYKELLVDKKTIVDSLESENRNRECVILELETEIKLLDDRIVSLSAIKTDIIKNKFQVSNNISESVKLLKQNLLCDD